MAVSILFALPIRRPTSTTETFWESPGRATAWPWQCHGYAMALPWRCHGHAMAMPWHVQGDAIAMPEQCHGNAREGRVNNKVLTEQLDPETLRASVCFYT